MHPFRAVALSLTLVTLASHPARAQAGFRITAAPAVPILLDGQLSDAGWADAREVPLPDGIRLLAKQMGGDVFLAVATGVRLPRPVDIYLQGADGEIYQLHASAQIGERHLPRDGWSDTIPAWRWGNHVGWIANEAKLDSERARELPFARRAFEADGVEFQLRRTRFPGERWRVRVDVGFFPGTEGSYRYPATATDDPASWAVVELPPVSG